MNSDASNTRERACLGAAILDVTGHQAAVLLSTLREDDFSSPLNRAVFVAIRRLVARGVLPLDYVSLVGELQETGRYSHYADAAAYVSSLGEGIVIAQDMTIRAKQVRASARERRLVRDAERIVARGR